MTDSTGHLDLDALADVLAGERDDAHLRSCAPCTDRLAELAASEASVTAALAALPAPPVPDGLSARLAEALRAERRREVAAVRPLRRRAPSWLPAVAASAVLVMAGAVGWSLLDLSGPGAQDAATSAAGGGQESSDDTTSDDTTSEDTTRGTASTAPEAAAGLAAPRPAAPTTDWADEAARPAALARLLAAADAPAADAPAGSATGVPSGDALDRLRDPAQLQACLTSLPGGAEDVLAVDYAQYAGDPAVAVVRPADPGSVEVTVVGSGCSAEDPALLSGTVLPRP